ncbi:MAG TPA: hypothetical protein VF618_18575 [Thermoanaerobaculia bacterium]
MLTRRFSLLLLILLTTPLAQAAKPAAERCVAAVATFEQSLGEDGDDAQFAAYKRLVRETYNVCRASDAPTEAKIAAYKAWAIVEPDQKKAIAGLFAGVDELEKRHGKDAPELLPLLLHLGLTAAAENREEGEALLERALAIQKSHYGESSEAVAEGYMHLAVVALVAEDLTLAEHRYRIAIDIARKACGPECSTLATAILALADIVKRDPKRVAELEALMQDVDAATPKEPRRKRKQAS